MEHRIGQNSPPVHAAGTDPAFIPGLTPPRAAEALEQPPVAAAEAAPDAVQDTAQDAVQDTSDGAAQRTAPDAHAEPEAEAETVEEEPRPVADGPVFEASDRRGSITVDGTGVTFRLDEETAEFSWPEIGAVEMDTPRFGRRLTVTVYTTGRRSYDAEVEAPNRSLPKQWAAELDAVLDAYFEDTSS